MRSRKIDMTGTRYNSVIAVNEAGIAASRDTKWLFLCDCGNLFEANGYYVRCGKVKDCPSCAAERVRMASVKHWLSNTAEFSTWTDIQTRCYNSKTKAFKHYGGRGIVVCKRWLDSFDNFLSDMGNRPSKNHSIERINVNGNYEPSNCKWVTDKEQANNKRSNVLVTLNGITKNVTEWIIDLNLNKNTVNSRIYNLKWPLEKALTKGTSSCK